MAAALSFYVGDSFLTFISAGSGLGYYGSSFGASVPVGSFADTCYVTNSLGVVQNLQTDYVKWVHNSSGQVAGGVNLPLQSIPNDVSNFNIRFTYDSPVKVQNAQIRIYDRTTVTRGPSGVTAAIFEARHPSPIQGATGSGNTSWFYASGTYDNQAFTLGNSPGISGLFNNGTSLHQDTRHDWYINLSASPDSIGSKTNFALYCSVEYL